MVLREFLAPRCSESKVTVHTLTEKKNLTKKYRFFMEKNDFEKIFPQNFDMFWKCWRFTKGLLRDCLMP